MLLNGGSERVFSHPAHVDHAAVGEKGDSTGLEDRNHVSRSAVIAKPLTNLVVQFVEIARNRVVRVDVEAIIADEQESVGDRQYWPDQVRPLQGAPLGHRRYPGR